MCFHLRDDQFHCASGVFFTYKCPLCEVWLFIIDTTSFRIDLTYNTNRTYGDIFILCWRNQYSFVSLNQIVHFHLQEKINEYFSIIVCNTCLLNLWREEFYFMGHRKYVLQLGYLFVHKLVYKLLSVCIYVCIRHGKDITSITTLLSTNNPSSMCNSFLLLVIRILIKKSILKCLDNVYYDKYLGTNKIPIPNSEYCKSQK